ncbi:MAG: ATP-binding protein [Acidobacteria bacterium]|nr:ATP-binding protein [Acidobacteriota bacterium]
MRPSLPTSLPGRGRPVIFTRRPQRMPPAGNLIRLDFPSHLDMLDVVQVLTDHAGQVGGLDEETIHWVGVAVRESVINAIKHGNGEDRNKRVTVEIRLEPRGKPLRLVIRVLDQGPGFDPDAVADPLAPENLLRSSGRGIFFMRSFMDDIRLQRIPEGGMEVRMVKKLDAAE